PFTSSNGPAITSSEKLFPMAASRELVGNRKNISHFIYSTDLNENPESEALLHGQDKKRAAAGGRKPLQ
ncbi:MAG: hypothetical protein V1794_02230, partial [Candidatus Glassbacteria bacterium]